MNKRRSSTQLEQEKKSRLQLEERLSDFGWHLAAPSPDLGEDFIVQIYHEGQNTGVNFYIQEKSITNLEERKTKDNSLVYTLKVKDLKHWEKFSLPVVVFIWDVNLREGKWGLIKELISKLDVSNPKWRKNKSDVQVYLPWKNGSDDQSLKRLKSEIGRQVYPLISFGKDLNVDMRLSFSDTTDGVNLRHAFDLHIKEGEPVTLRGDVIQELKFSDWWETWFGRFEPNNVEIQIGEASEQDPKFISFRIIPVKNKFKTVTLKNLEFKIIRKGTELIKYSNEHTSCPLLFTFTIRREEKMLVGNFSYLFRHMESSAYEMLDFLDFQKGLSLGGKLHVEFHDFNQSISTDSPPLPDTDPDLAFYDLVSKLCFVQDRLGISFKIPKEGIAQKDADSILELYEITSKGIVEYKNSKISLELKGKALQILLDGLKQNKPITLKFEYSDSYVKLFGEEIHVGPMVREVFGFASESVLEIENKLNTLSPDEFVNIEFNNVNGKEILLNWLSESK